MKAKRGVFLHSIYNRFWVFEVGLYSVNGADNFCESDFSSPACSGMADVIKIGLSYRPGPNPSLLAYQLHSDPPHGL